MTAIDHIRQWCATYGFAFSYGNPNHVEVWMGETDFSSSTDGVAVFSHLLTSEEWDGSHDTSYVGVWFASLVPFDFDNETIDATTEMLKNKAKALLASIQQGNAFGWDGARFQYGYDDYAENVAWCCLRVTLTALTADCVPLPAPQQEWRLMDVSADILRVVMDHDGTPLCDGFSTGGVGLFTAFGAVVNTEQMDAAQVSVTIDGFYPQADIIATKVTAEVVEEIPALSEYLGWWMAAAIFIVDEGQHTIEVDIVNVGTFNCEAEV